MRVALTRMVSARGPGALRRWLPAFGPTAGPPAPPGRGAAPRHRVLGRQLGHRDCDRGGDRCPSPCHGLRTVLQDNRFGELREGVWLRPDNLANQLPDELRDRVRVLNSRDDDPASLACVLWDLPGWSRTGHRLLDDMAAADDIPGRFVAAAGAVRRLFTDPGPARGVAAEPLAGGSAAGEVYTRYAAELSARRDDVAMMSR